MVGQTDYSSAPMDTQSSSNSNDQDCNPKNSKPTELKPLEREISQPSGLTAMTKPLQFLKTAWEPKSYQKRAIQLLLSQAAAGLFLDPGLGKTSTVLATIKILLSRNLIKKVLIIAPLRVAQKVWPDEIEKWEDFHHLRWTVLHGTQKNLKLKLDADIYFINPEGLEWLAKEGSSLLDTVDVLVVDESSRFKDSQTKRFKLLKSYLPRFSRRWILTGTPAPNGIMDLFGQAYILDLGRSLGRFITHYRKEFFDQSPYVKYEWTPKPDAFARVTDRISPLVLQLSAEDYLAMPKLMNLRIPVSLPDSTRLIYDELENEFISWLDNNRAIVASTSAVAGGKLRQCSNGAVYTLQDKWEELHEEKLDALESLLEEFNGSPCLIFYEFDHDRIRIQRRWPNIPVLGSGLSQAEFSALCDRFNAGTVPALLCHPASVGHGLNLQGSCNRAVWFAIPWNLEFYDQAIARIYRQGQKAATVFVYHIVAGGTIDERIMKVLEQKDRIQQDLLTALSRHRKEVLGETSN